MRLTLDGPDWTYGTMLRLRSAPHTVYMFMHRKPRGYMADGSPIDRGFVALAMSKCVLYPACSQDHDRLGKCWPYGGLPGERLWQVVT